jgi:hypothetical protein
MKLDLDKQKKQQLKAQILSSFANDKEISLPAIGRAGNNQSAMSQTQQ